MRSGKKLSWLTLPSLLCIFGVLLAACGGGSVPGSGGSTGSSAKAPASQQVYRWGFNLTDIASFDPGVATDNPSLAVIETVFTGLVQLDQNLNIKPQLASSYDVSSDGLTYTFHLRPNLKFSDGTKLDANDVAYSVDRSLSPEVNNLSGSALTYLGTIKGAADRTNGKIKSVIGTGVIVSDPNTIVFKLSQPSAYFLGALTYPTSYPVEKSVIDKWGLNNWTDHLADNGGQGGDGPFKVKSYSHTTGIKLVPNSNYYGKQPQLKELDYVPFKDTQTEYNAYLANQVDYTWIPLPQYPTAKNRPDFVKDPALTVFYIAMNSKVKPLENNNIRTAMSLAINREVMNETIFKGAYIPTCHIVPEGQYGYNPNLKCPGGSTPAGDKALAVQYFEKGLKEEGLTRATFPQLTFTYPSSSTVASDETQTAIQMWKQTLGITINSTTISQNDLFKQLTNTYGKSGPLQIWVSGWGADFPDPEDWITLQFGPGQANNATNFANNTAADIAQQQEAQANMAKADSMFGTSATALANRAAAYNKIEQQLVDDGAWIPLYQRPELQLIKTYIHGFNFNAATQIPPDAWGNIYVSQH
jgi:peptide/nickel transport system substrate-binding protein/oligopeptide transport system substrate-binding protein